MACGQRSRWTYRSQTLGLQPGVFQIISPVYLREEERELEQLCIALTDAQRMAPIGSPVEKFLRRSLIRETRHDYIGPLSPAR